MPASAAPLKKALADYQLAVLTGLHTGQPASNLGSVATGKALSQALGTTTAFRSKSWSLRGSLIYAVLTATITCESARELDLGAGQPAVALIKASQIILAVE